MREAVCSAENITLSEKKTGLRSLRLRARSLRLRARSLKLRARSLRLRAAAFGIVLAAALAAGAPESDAYAAAAKKNTAKSISAKSGKNAKNTKKTKKSKKRGLVVLANGKARYYDKKTGRLVKKGWATSRYYVKKGYAVRGVVKVNGEYCVFDPVTFKLSKGKKKHFVTIDGVAHLVTKKGEAFRGWRNEGGRWVCYDKKGVRIVSKKVDGVQIDENGLAPAGISKPVSKKKESAVMVKANAIVDRITSPGMSKAAKLRRCWNYIVGGSFHYASVYPSLGSAGWQRSCALRMLNTHGGNCYGFACAFAALAKACGYKPYVVAGYCHGTRDGRGDGLTRHCCVRIGGAWYDPELQFSGGARGIYGSGYSAMRSISQTVAF